MSKGSKLHAACCVLHGMLQGCTKYPMLKESKEIKIAIIKVEIKVDLRHLCLMSKESKVHSIYNVDSNSKYSN